MLDMEVSRFGSRSVLASRPLALRLFSGGWNVEICGSPSGGDDDDG